MYFSSRLLNDFSPAWKFNTYSYCKTRHLVWHGVTDMLEQHIIKIVING